MLTTVRNQQCPFQCENDVPGCLGNSAKQLGFTGLSPSKPINLMHDIAAPVAMLCMYWAWGKEGFTKQQEVDQMMQDMLLNRTANERVESMVTDAVNQAAANADKLADALWAVTPAPVLPVAVPMPPNGYGAQYLIKEKGGEK